MIDPRPSQDEIRALREAIDRLDDRLLALLIERAGCVRQIADIKRRIGHEVIDAGREREILDRFLARNAGRLPIEDLQNVLGALRRMMRRQTGLGPPGPSRP